MSKGFRWPCALTIAGSDSGGGAGIQADLKTFAALRVHGTSAITCVTAQNPRRVTSIEPMPATVVVKQMQAALEAFPVKAIKLGMLYSRSIIEAVGAELEGRHKRIKVIADPVMISTSGKALLQRAAQRAYERCIIPHSTLITPNIPEAEALGAGRIENPDELRQAARKLYDKFGTAVLMKGGHLRKSPRALDIYFDGKSEVLLEAPYIKKVRTHGTGCTYSAAIAGWCARGNDLESAVIQAKQFVSEAIANYLNVGKEQVLNQTFVFES